MAYFTCKKVGASPRGRLSTRPRLSLVLAAMQRVAKRGVALFCRQMNSSSSAAEMKELASRICRDYLYGAWKFVNAQNVAVKHIRWASRVRVADCSTGSSPLQRCNSLASWWRDCSPIGRGKVAVVLLLRKSWRRRCCVFRCFNVVAFVCYCKVSNADFES